MKYRVEVDGAPWLLELKPNGSQLSFCVEGEETTNGSASVEEVMPGIFSILLNHRSIRVHVAPNGKCLEVWSGPRRYVIAAADMRDSALNKNVAGSGGPMELSAQMPGKVIKLLHPEGAAVGKGQGLMVVEAMKMQNEVKSPKDCVVVRFHVVEGATVNAGDLLVTIE